MWAAVQRDAALMIGNLFGYSEQRGISLHLVPWSAALCHGMPPCAMGCRILHRAFPAEYGQMEQLFARLNIQ